MSNQTFVKKDRISFAQNSNEQTVIAPFTNDSIYLGPNSAITYDGSSNVQNIDYLTGVTLSNQYIYADGTYLSNLPTTGGITQSNLNSTLTGLGTIGYISSSQLTSTVTGLGIGTNQSVVNSTIVGLGTFGYISSLSLQSTVQGLGNIYISSAGANQNAINSTIIGLGTFGYISSSQLTSTVTGLVSGGNPATWANYPAINTVDVAGNIISNADILLVNTISSATSGYVDITSFINLQQNSIFGVNNLQTDSISANNYGNVRFDASVNMNANAISNINTAYFGYNITTTYQDGLYMQEYTAPDASVTSPALGLSYNAIPFVGTSSNNSLVNLYNVNNIWVDKIHSVSANISNLTANDVNIVSTLTVPNLSTSLLRMYTTGTIPPNIIFSDISGNVTGIIGYDNQSLQVASRSSIQLIAAGGLGGSILFTNANLSNINNIYASNINTSSITGDGSQLFNLNAISSASLQSTVQGLGNIYISSAGANQNAINSTIIGLGTFGYISSLNSISSLNISSGNLFAGLISTLNINASTMRLDKLFGGPIAGATTTQNLYPFSDGAQIGFGSNIAQNGFYSEGHFKSTFTQVIQPTLDNDGFSNVVRINGNISTPNIIVSTLVANTITTSNISSFFYGGIEKYDYVSSVALQSSIVGLGTFGYISTQQLQSTVRGLGNIYLSSFNGSTTFLSSAVGFISSLTVNSLTVGTGAGWVDFGAIRAVIISSIQTNTGLLNASSITGDGSQIYNLNAISSLSLISTVTGLGNIYISSGGASQPAINSTIVGLGTFGYISSSQLQSTVIGLGNIYISSGGATQNAITSTIIGLGTFGYLSTNIVPSTIVGLGTFGYISSTQLQSTVRGLGSIYLSTNTVPSTIVGLGTFGYLSSLNSISSLNISSGNIFAATVSTQNINASTMRLDKLFGGPIAGATTTQNLYPFSDGAQIGFGSNTSQNGFYSEGHFKSTFTQVIQPSLDAGQYSNIVYINGNISTPNIIVSTLVANTITTSNISSFFYGGIEKYNYISSLALQSTVTGLGTFGYISTQQLQSTVRGLGNIYLSSFNGSTNFLSSGQAFISSLTVNSLTIGSGTGFVDFGAVRALLFSSFQVNTGVLNASSLIGDGSQLYNLPAISSLSLQSTIRGLGTFGYISTSQLTSTVTGLVDHLELNSTVAGLGSFGYISSSQLISTVTGLGNIYISSGGATQNAINSTIIGLGTFGYISSSQLQSTVRGLGSIYLSSFNGSTNFLSSGQAFISSLVVNSLQFGVGNGWLSVDALQAVLVSSIQTDTAILNASSLKGDGSQIYNLNAISSLSLISTVTGLGNIYISSGGASQPAINSTIVGLGTFGYISSSQLISTVIGLGNIYISSGGATQNAITSTIVGLGTFGYISTNTVPSTIVGLGTFGYISSTQLQSTTRGLGNIYLSTNIVPSTIIGLGTFGYISSTQLQSTVTGLVDHLELNSTILGLGTFGYISSSQLQSTVRGLGSIYLSTNTVPSTIVGLGTFGYISTNIVPSTIVGLGTFGYISSSQLQSTVTGLGNIYISSGGATQNAINSTIVGLGTFGYISTNTVPSTIVGLGTFGYISSSQLTSTILGLGTFCYISTNTVPSTIVGLGTFGYISSSQLTSTVTGLVDHLELNSTTRGLGTLGYISSLRVSTLFISTLIASTVSTTLLYASTAVITNILDQYQYIKSATNDWSWIVRNWTNSPGSNQMNAPTALFSSFYESESRVASNTRFQHTASLNSVSYITYGGLTNYKAIATSYIQVITPFTLTSVKFDVDDTGSFWDNGNIITGQSVYNGGTGTLYNYYFTVGWHRLDLIWYQGGGGDYIQLGWNPANYTNYIAMMSAYGPNDRITNYLGNVGIGLAYPSTTLDVGGVIRAPFISTISLNVNTISSGVNVTFTNGLIVSSINTNSISSGNITTSNISSFFYGGIEKYNYISSIALQSTTTGLGNIYLSTNTVPSTIVGLGTFGYISSTQLYSTVTGVTFNYSAITISTANVRVSSLTFVDLRTNSTNSLYMNSTFLYFGNNIVVGALQYTSQLITF